MLLLLVFKDPSGASYHHPKHSLRGSSRTKSPHPGGGGGVESAVTVPNQRWMMMGKRWRDDVGWDQRAI